MCLVVIDLFKVFISYLDQVCLLVYCLSMKVETTQILRLNKVAKHNFLTLDY